MPGIAAGLPLVVLDNGGGYVRAGLAAEAGPTVVEPNCTAVAKGQAGRAPVIGMEALELPAYAIHRPARRGLVLDMEQQRVIWDTVLHKRLGVDPRACAVLVTEAPLSPASLRREMEEVLFEVFGFREVCILPGPPLALHSPGLRCQLDGLNPCCTVLSAGHSGCVALPCIEGQIMNLAVRRLNVGGRVLTNLLMERLGIQHFDLSENWLLVEDILSKVGEVSLDFDADLRTRFTSVKPKTYVLPDFHTQCTGFVKELLPAEMRAMQRRQSLAEAPGQQQHVTLGAERVTMPEALFRPKDQGIQQAGVAELVQQAILGVNGGSWQPHFGQVALCGGLARLPNFRQRLQRELRQLLPISWPVKVVAEEEPELSVWRGAAQLALNEEFRLRGFRSQRAWEEQGASVSNTTAIGVGGTKRKAT